MKRLIDLHLHLDGSVPISSIKKLMKRRGEPVMSDEELRAKLSVSPHCRNLEEFLQKFPFPLSFMQTKDDLQTIVFDLLQELRKQGLVYVEIRFAPQLENQKGLTQTEVVRAAISGMDQFFAWQKKQNSDQPELHANLILCMMRLHGKAKENEETLRVAKRFLGKGVGGIDLAGAETPEFAAHKYAFLFKQAKCIGLPFTIHAGEGMGPESVQEALDLGAKRIGHGIRAIEDPAVMKEIIDRGVTLECCATSNLNTKAFTQIDDYPVKKMLDEGVKVTLNSDDMTVCNINLPHEYKVLEEKTGLTAADEKQLYLNAAHAAFCSKKEKQRLLSLVN